MSGFARGGVAALVFMSSLQWRTRHIDVTNLRRHMLFVVSMVLHGPPWSSSNSGAYDTFWACVGDGFGWDSIPGSKPSSNAAWDAITPSPLEQWGLRCKQLLGPRLGKSCTSQIMKNIANSNRWEAICKLKWRTTLSPHASSRFIVPWLPHGCTLLLYNLCIVGMAPPWLPPSCVQPLPHEDLSWMEVQIQWIRLLVSIILLIIVLEQWFSFSEEAEMRIKAGRKPKFN